MKARFFRFLSVFPAFGSLLTPARIIQAPSCPTDSLPVQTSTPYAPAISPQNLHASHKIEPISPQSNCNQISSFFFVLRRLFSPWRTRKKQNEKPGTPDISRFSGLWWGKVDSNHRRQCQQIYSLSPLATREFPHINFEWSWWTDSNPRPADYKSAALPTELHQHAPGQQPPSSRPVILAKKPRFVNRFFLKMLRFGF